MSVYQTLEKENAAIRGNLHKLIDTSAAQQRERSALLREIKARMKAECQIEEDFLYPILINDARSKEQAEAIRGQQNQILKMLDSLEEDAKDRPEFQQKIERLYFDLMAYLELEESQLFKLSRQVVPKEHIERISPKATERLIETRNRLIQ